MTRCAYCRIMLTDNGTRDHVPPRFIFKNHGDEINEQRITIPCCFECNQKFSIIEQNLIPLFNRLYDGLADSELIESFDKNGEFSLLMKKIAIGYRYKETSKLLYDDRMPEVSYFLSNDVDRNWIQAFKKIRYDDCIEDISSNPTYPGLIITIDHKYFACAPTDIFSIFWHEYSPNSDYVRMSFYDTLFVQVNF